MRRAMQACWWLLPGFLGCGDAVPADRAVDIAGSPGVDGMVDVDGLPELVLTRELRLGSLDDPEEGFTRIGGVDVDARGWTYVVEREVREVRVYDRVGRRVRTIGRSGEGPGEFESEPSALGVVGDTLWVASRYRVSLFRKDGTFLTRTRSGLDVARVGPSRMFPSSLRSDGRFGSRWIDYVRLNDPAQDTVLVPRLVFDTMGAVVDTAGFHPYAPPPRGPSFAVGGVTMSTPAPNGNELRLGRGDTVVVVSRPPPEEAADAMFTVTRVVPFVGRRDDGSPVPREDTVAHLRYRYRPRPFDDAAVDGMIRFRRDVFEAVGADLAAVEARIRGLDLPRFQIPVSEAWLGADGTVWLRREEDGAPVSRWLWIAPDGTPRGHIELSPAARIRWASGHRIWVVETDELAVPWLVHYRVG